MNGKGIKNWAVVVLLAITMVAAIAAPVSAKTLPYPASDYIKDVTVGNPGDLLNYNNGGARILLTSEGDSVGRFWSGAWAISGWVISSWEQQTGKVMAISMEISRKCGQ